MRLSGTVHTPVPHKKKRSERGHSQTSRAEKEGGRVRPVPGHSSPDPQGTAPLTPALRRGSLSLALVASPSREIVEEDLQLPSTPEIFEAAKELIKQTAHLAYPRHECTQDCAEKAPVPSRGKPGLMARPRSLRHQSPAQSSIMVTSRSLRH